MSEITLNGMIYVPKETESPVMGEKRIIVTDRGWIFVGICTENENGTVTIKNAFNIRRWGTTKGLGELVNGALADTQYDYYGTVTATPIVQIAVVSGWDYDKSH